VRARRLRPGLTETRRRFPGVDLGLLAIWIAAASSLSVVAAAVRDWFALTDELVYERLAISIAHRAEGGSLLTPVLSSSAKPASPGPAENRFPAGPYFLARAARNSINSETAKYLSTAEMISGARPTHSGTSCIRCMT